MEDAVRTYVSREIYSHRLRLVDGVTGEVERNDEEEDGADDRDDEADHLDDHVGHHEGGLAVLGAVEKHVAVRETRE